MDQDHIVSAFGQLMIKHKGPRFPGVGMRQAFGAVCPTATERRQVKDRTVLALRIRPEPWDRRRNECRLTRQVEGHPHDMLNVSLARGAVHVWFRESWSINCLNVPARSRSNRSNADRFGVRFGSAGVQPSPTPQHRLFDLLGDDGPDFAEVFPNRLPS